MAKPSKTNKDQLDAAAVCMAATEPQASCAEHIRDFLCRVFCCANAHPFKNAQDNNYRQACADKLLTAIRLSSNGKRKNECGKVGNVQFFNSFQHDMKPMTDQEKKDHSDIIDDPNDYSVKKDINGNFIEYKERIPDVTIFDENMDVAAIYDFKFPKDRRHDKQHSDYVRLAGYKEDKVDYLTKKTCSCSKEKELSPQKKQQVLDNLHNSIPEFFS